MNVHPPSPSTPFANFRAEVEALYRADRARKTYLRVRQVLREVEAQGVATPGDLTPLVVSAWVAAMPPRAPLTKRALLSTLRTICRFGVGRGYLDRSPFDAWTIRVRGTKAKRPRHHSAAQITTVLEGLRDRAASSWKSRRIYALAAVVALTGLRKLEALRLQWGDLDLAAGTLGVSARFRLKTEESERTIGIPDELVQVLVAWRPWSDSVWVFPNVPRSGPWLEGSPGNKPLDALKAAGLRSGVAGVTFQAFRHSWGTHAQLLFRLSPAQVAKNLGHTTITTAYANYVHDDLDDLREAVRPIRFGRLHSPPPPPGGPRC